MLINLFGNILVWFVVLKFRDIRIPMNYLLVNLAISDMMVGFFMSPRFIFGRMLNHPGGTLGDYFCKILTGDSFTWTGALASDVTLVCIAVERYLSIRFPHSNEKRLTTKKLRYVIPLCWTFALGVNLPPFFYLKYDKNSGSCVPFWPTPNFIKYHSVINTHMFFVFPVLIMGCSTLFSFINSGLKRKLRPRLWLNEQYSSTDVTPPRWWSQWVWSTAFAGFQTVLFTSTWLTQPSSCSVRFTQHRFWWFL